MHRLSLCLSVSLSLCLPVSISLLDYCPSLVLPALTTTTTPGGAYQGKGPADNRAPQDVCRVGGEIWHLATGAGAICISISYGRAFDDNL